MDRVFLDANILFSASYRDGSGLVRLWELPDVELLTSGYAAEEALRNLESRAQRQRLRTLLERVIASPEKATGRLPQDLLLPAKDQPIFLAAAAAGATHLLTGDAAHFGPFFGRSFDGVLILRPAVYLRRNPPPGP